MIDVQVISPTITITASENNEARFSVTNVPVGACDQCHANTNVNREGAIAVANQGFFNLQCYPVPALGKNFGTATSISAPDPKLLITNVPCGMDLSQIPALSEPTPARADAGIAKRLRLFRRGLGILLKDFLPKW